MRREWSGWIKNRQWDEFQRLAKTDPDEVLADTVAELERGFPDKADRKALRKILYQLALAGYRPRPIEDDAAVEESKPFEFGFLVSSDASGDGVITYGVEERGRVRWLVAHVNGAYGITRADEEDHSLTDSRTKAERLRTSNPRPFLCSEIEPGYALGRIREAVDRTTGTKAPAIAYWRSRLDRAEPLPHPAESLPREECDSETRKNLSIALDAAKPWRLELGFVSPLMRELYELEMHSGMPEEERQSKASELTAAARAVAITDDVIRDHEMRLLDVAYLLHLRGEPGSGLALSALDDLRARGAESDYAQGIFDKTLLVLAETLLKPRDVGATAVSL